MSHMEAKSSVSFWDKVECHILRQSQMSHIEAKTRVPYGGKVKCHIFS